MARVELKRQSSVQCEYARAPSAPFLAVFASATGQCGRSLSRNSAPVTRVSLLDRCVFLALCSIAAAAAAGHLVRSFVHSF